MEALGQPRTLRAAALSTCATVLLSYPRLAVWMERPKALWFLLAILALSCFVLWAFVYAWYPTQPRGHVFQSRGTLFDWGLATVLGLACAFLLALLVDPRLRVVTPEDYPPSFTAWLIGTLWTIAFLQLFLVLAPLAFFYRLLNRRVSAAVGTVAFGVLLLVIKLSGESLGLSASFVGILFGVRVVFGGLAVWWALRGGPLLLWWWVLVIQARLLLGMSDL